MFVFHGSLHCFSNCLLRLVSYYPFIFLYLFEFFIRLSCLLLSLLDGRLGPSSLPLPLGFSLPLKNAKPYVLT